ncbi:hypothetical protein Tco_0948934 [Tanacetum coccineum]
MLPIRFIKVSKISCPMMKLLEKDPIFNFKEECIKEFETLKEKLMNTLIMVSPDWDDGIDENFPDETLMKTRVRTYAEGKHFRPIDFANKTLN